MRFLPEFDNALLGHADRSRIMTLEDRPPLFPGNGASAGTVLVDGFLTGLWKIVRAKAKATLKIEPNRPLATAEKAALTDEGERLLDFAAADSKTTDVQFLKPGRTLVPGPTASQPG